MPNTVTAPGPEVVWGPTAQDYAQHRLGPPDEAYRRLAALGVGLPGQRVVDLGTGTAMIARALAVRGCAVIGVDVDAGMLAAARERIAAAGLSVELHQAPAESTGLAAGAFDVVIAAQCWHWFDRPRAAAEAWRLLAPGGVIALISLDWVRLPGNLIDRTMTLAARHRAAPMPPQTTVGGEAGFYGRFAQDLGEAGFGGLEAFVFDLDVAYEPDGWRGRIRASVPVLMMTPDEAAGFDRAHAELLAAGPSPLRVPHRMSAIVARKPPR